MYFSLKSGLVLSPLLLIDFLVGCSLYIFVCKNMGSTKAKLLRPNKKFVFQVTGLKILGRVGTHIVF